jgi:hypothetical protein
MMEDNDSWEAFEAVWQANLDVELEAAFGYGCVCDDDFELDDDAQEPGGDAHKEPAAEAAQMADPEPETTASFTNGRRWPLLRGEVGELLVVAEDADVFRGDDGLNYARVPTRFGSATWRLESPDFEGWLAFRFMSADQVTVADGDVKSAIKVIGQWCRHEGRVLPVALRVAQGDGVLWLDLGDETGEAVAITQDGWSVTDNPPVCFQRPAGMGPLPRPERGGTLKLLGKHFNVDDDDRTLLTAWLLACLRPDAPQVILSLSSSQGSAKSSAAGLLCRVIDPGAAVLKALPPNEAAILAAAERRYVLAFDNTSALSLSMSDALCRMSTGSARVRLVGKQEVAATLRRPVILTGIVDLIRRPDLADRALRVELRPIDGMGRRTQEDIQAAFAADHPRILGALLDAAVAGLCRLPGVTGSLPRMADFARWVFACAPAFTDTGNLRALLAENQLSVSGDILDEDPLGGALRRLLLDAPEWSGTASHLLAALRRVTPKGEGRLPTRPEQLSSGLRRIEEDLRRHGMTIKRDRIGNAGTRMIFLRAAV